jgi:hypothetical protein
LIIYDQIKIFVRIYISTHAPAVNPYYWLAK